MFNPLWVVPLLDWKSQIPQKKIGWESCEEQANKQCFSMASKPVSVYRLLPCLGSCHNCFWWSTAIWKYEWNKPFFPKLHLIMVFHHRKRNPKTTAPWPSCVLLHVYQKKIKVSIWQEHLHIHVYCSVITNRQVRCQQRESSGEKRMQYVV